MAVKRLYKGKLEKVAIPGEVETFTNVYYNETLKYRIWYGNAPPANYILEGDIWRYPNGSAPDIWRMRIGGAWVSMLASATQDGLMSVAHYNAVENLSSLLPSIYTDATDHYANTTTAHGMTTSATANRLALRTSGGGLNAVFFNSSSSERFKKDIREFSDAIDILLKLRGVRFTWKDTDEQDVGMIAEEVQKHIPEIVKEEDGLVVGLVYDRIVALLVEGFKKLHNDVDQIKAKLGMT